MLDGSRQNFVDDVIDIGICLAREFGRYGVRGEQGRADAEPGRFAEPASHPQHLELGVEVQAVTGLDLDGCHALASKRLQPGQRVGVQLVLAGRAGGRHGGQDAAAFSRYFFVADAAKPPLVFLGPLAAEDEVRMTVDEGGRHPAPGQGACFRRCPGREFRRGADPVDDAVANRDCAVVDRAVIGLALPHRGDAGVGQQQVPFAHQCLRNCKAT